MDLGAETVTRPSRPGRSTKRRRARNTTSTGTPATSQENLRMRATGQRAVSMKTFRYRVPRCVKLSRRSTTASHVRPARVSSTP